MLEIVLDDFLPQAKGIFPECRKKCGIVLVFLYFIQSLAKKTRATLFTDQMQNFGVAARFYLFLL